MTWYDLPVNPSYINQVLATGAVTFNYSSKWLNAISITTTDAAALAAINALPFVVSETPVQRHKPYTEFSEEGNENNFSHQSTPLINSPLAYNYGGSYSQVHQINVDCLHTAGHDGAGIQIAVLDDGFNNVNTVNAFDSIRMNNQILGTHDFVTGIQDVYSVGGHGTMVLSDMASNLPGQIIGTAPHASYWLIRTEEAATEYIIEEDNWVAGAEFADSVGADIICTSLYYTQFDDASQNHTYPDMNGRTTVCAIAATFTARVGMLTFACAGNSGTSSWFYVGSPADADSICAVGAVDNTGALANFSSRGPSADGRVKPDISARGVNATVVNSGNAVTFASGTSFATPLSAGGAAALWSAYPNYTSMQLRNSIIMSATQFNNPDSLEGYGIPDFCLAGIILSNTKPGNNFGNNISVYPNPNDGEMIFEYSIEENKSGSLEIYDVNGKLISSDKLQSGKQNLKINRESWSNGIYFYRFVVDGEMVKSGKVVINN